MLPILYYILYWSIYQLWEFSCSLIFSDAHLHQAKGLPIRNWWSTNFRAFKFVKTLINVHCLFSKLNWIDQYWHLPPKSHISPTLVNTSLDELKWRMSSNECYRKSYEITKGIRFLLWATLISVQKAVYLIT